MASSFQSSASAPSRARDQVVVSTKFGFDIDLTTGQRRGGVNRRPEHIRQVVDAQLRRLRTAFRPSAALTPGTRWL